MSKLALILSDADRSATSPLAWQVRSQTTVADAEAAQAADILARFAAAYSRGDVAAMRVAACDAGAYDLAHPDEPRLLDELAAIRGIAIAA
ncbi:hypothetical protein [Streptomyces lydicus]|uniref:hypothetical protein n=1 Tax=Streptomyces lydicus TaxID=47763 RepID=UPI0037882662